MRLRRKDPRAGFLPVFFASILATFLSSILRMLFVLAVPVIALMWFGQPALRFQYWWHGSEAYPTYDRCLYIALDGWHMVTPGYGGNAGSCPLILFVPADIPKLIWG